MNTLISIITVCYNDIEGLRRTVASIRKQRQHCKLEHIVVDGSSTDGSREYLAELYADGVIDLLVSEEDDGIYDAMNKGLSLFRKDWVHFLNAGDEYVSEWSLCEALAFLDPDYLNYFDLYQWCVVSGRFERKEFPYCRKRLNVGCYLMQPATILHRRQIEDTGLFSLDYSIAGDYEYLLRLVDRYQAKRHAHILTRMESGGISDLNYAESFRQFRDVSIKFGVSPVKANLIYLLKMLNSKLKRTLR